MAFYDESDGEEARKAIGDLAAKTKVCEARELGAKEKRIMKKAAAVVCFLRSGYMSSMEEVIAYAASLNKEIIPVYFDRFELSPGMRMILGTKQGVSKYKYEAEDEYRRELASSPVFSDLALTPEQKNRFKVIIALIAFAAVAVAAAATLIVYQTFFAGEKIAPDSTLGKLGLSGNINSIKKVYVYGAELRDAFEKDGVHLIVYAGDYDKTKVILPSINGTVERGTLADVSDFSQLVNLEELSLAGNPVSDLTPLWSLGKLRKLDVSANFTENESGLDLTGIRALSNLEFLNIAYCQIGKGLEELKELPKLKTVYANHELEEQLMALGSVSFEIVYIDTAVSSYEEFKAAAENEHVYFILFRNPADAYAMQDSESGVQNMEINIPEGDTITLRKNVQLGGIHTTLNIYGTLIVDGEVEMGLSYINNYGTLDVREGGYYLCGMADTVNYGTMIIEKGARQQVERGNVIALKDGCTYTLNGTLALYIGGSFYHEGGTMTNNGLIEIAHTDGFDWYPEDVRLEADNLPGTGTVSRIEIEWDTSDK